MATDVLFGFGGNDVLVGGPGFDMLVGGVGDDVYILDGGGDRVVEGPNEGIDTIQSQPARPCYIAGSMWKTSP